MANEEYHLPRLQALRQRAADLRAESVRLEQAYEAGEMPLSDEVARQVAIANEMVAVANEMKALTDLR